MNKNRRHAMVFSGVLTLAAILSGAAAAGNPHGTPPGQAKHESAQATVHAKVHANVHVHATVNSHASLHQSAHAGIRGKHQSSVVVTSSAAAGNSMGVKASATTGFGMHAAAGSSATKLYGNGRTAGQIAEQNGASASADLYGPGNSQPHKSALCFNSKMHLIDVHALKAHGATTFACVTLSGATGVTTSGSTGVHGNGHAFGHANGHANGVVGVKGGLKGHAGLKAKAALKHSRHSAVLGAKATLASSVNGQARPATAVVGTANFTG